MGDRVNCTLTIFGEFTHTQHELITAKLFGLEAETVDIVGSGLEAAFSEVNYGNMDFIDGLEDLLEEAECSSIWSWASGMGFSQGEQWFDVERGKTVQFEGSTPSVPLDALSDPVRIDSFKRWISWRAEQKYTVLKPEKRPRARRCDRAPARNRNVQH